ncbi:factor-independent urate hydroxylase [Actinophytocola algeriensis]|uniref:Uricase n=1 Tax=Actinophytocola algeriensis TaxID=1768010 RepID=A0A7W7QAB9_9PSEU|nr:urate oxidase [Actinophytocola algeriensis]MBB4909981.1 urate oxidase [Actinophytocola algeriensis]MBE1475971.1 urate oxidase [Actinophytocola algeriensis]
MTDHDIRLGDNQYGKAETRLVRVDRHDDRHEVTDLNVSTALAGDLAATHLTGDNAGVLPTDTQKNTVFAFARDGISSIEAFALRLARHFVDATPTIHRARVRIEQYSWARVADHSFVRDSGTRTTTVTYDGTAATVVSGVDDLVVMNTTGSEFHGFHSDRYTTLPETHDRILATAVRADWRHASAADTDWNTSHREAARHLVEAFADTHSLSLQQTLHAMGERVLRHREELAEVRLSLPNKHHFLVDLSPFELDNPGEVFFAADRPYGLIEGGVVRDGAPDPGLAWW